MPPHPRRIPFVDGDENTCSMLCGLLGLIDCHASTAKTVAQAL